MISVDKSTVKLNCPECRTGYVTDRSEITMARPEFDCASCGVRFYFECKPEIYFIENSAQDASDVELEPKTFKVPAARVNAVPGIPHDLNVCWDQVIRDYEKRELHLRFLDQCLKFKKLAFAAQLYRARIDAFPQDMLAREMGDRAFQMATEHMRSLHPQVPLFTSPKRKPGATAGFWMLLIYLGSIIAIAGLMAPHGKALVAFGAAMLSLGVGFKWIGRAPTVAN